MATFNSITGLKGTIGGVTFYYRNGKPVARKANGPSREKIATSPRCARTRENNAEFKGCVRASVMFRKAIYFFTKNFSNRSLSYRFNGIFRRVIDLAEGIRGRRPVEALRYRDLLRGVNVHPDISFYSVFKAPFEMAANDLRNEVLVSVPSFRIKGYMNAPEGATHYRLLLAVVVMPKLVHDVRLNDYVVMEGAAREHTMHVYSPYIGLSGKTTETVNIKAVLPGGAPVHQDSAVVCCLGIEFYQETGGRMYNLRQGCCMKVAEVY